MAGKGTQLLPPARYDHPYSGELVLHEVARDNVWQECSRDGVDVMRPDVAGCAFVFEAACIIFIATKTQRAPIKSILRHETAHCNGWKH